MIYESVKTFNRAFDQWSQNSEGFQIVEWIDKLMQAQSVRPSNDILVAGIMIYFMKSKW